MVRYSQQPFGRVASTLPTNIAWKEHLYYLAVGTEVNGDEYEMGNNELTKVDTCYVINDLSHSRISPAFYEKVLGHRSYKMDMQVTLQARVESRPRIACIPITVKVDEACEGDVDIDPATRARLDEASDGPKFVRTLRHRIDTEEEDREISRLHATQLPLQKAVAERLEAQRAERLKRDNEEHAESKIRKKFTKIVKIFVVVVQRALGSED